MEGHTLSAVEVAWAGGFSTRSDFARQHAEVVAEAACCGLITTFNPTTGKHGKQWLVTPLGCRKLFKESK